jgi:hypothetical protein
MLTSNTSELSPLAQYILQYLRDDFIKRNPSAHDFEVGYSGVAIDVIVQLFCKPADVTPLDVDFAIKELEECKYAWTGPREPYVGVHGAILISTDINKHEFVCLTERGYRALLKLREDQQRPVPSESRGDDTATVPPPGSRRPKSSPTLERARWAIRELYPDGVPGPSQEPNAILCRSVGKRLKQASQPGVSDDTILRAAGRRK